MEATKPQYYFNSYQFEDLAYILDIKSESNGKSSIILEKTIMYPQGGGQPYDKGVIFNDSASFSVEEVRCIDGVIHHIGHSTHGLLNIGDVVRIRVDESRRRLNAKLHSVGHLIDDAIHALDFNWEPVKGYHFPEGAYVEYRGALPDDNQTIAQKIQEKVNEFIAANTKVKAEVVESVQVLKDRGLKVPAYLSPNKPIRIVTLINPMPCGGTHVKELAEIGYVNISKIKMKEGSIRISYQVS